MCPMNVPRNGLLLAIFLSLHATPSQADNGPTPSFSLSPPLTCPLTLQRIQRTEKEFDGALRALWRKSRACNDYVVVSESLLNQALAVADANNKHPSTSDAALQDAKRIADRACARKAGMEDCGKTLSALGRATDRAEDELKATFEEGSCSPAQLAARTKNLKKRIAEARLLERGLEPRIANYTEAARGLCSVSSELRDIKDNLKSPSTDVTGGDS